MAQPVAFVPAHSYVADEGLLPLLPGSELDIDLNALKTTTDQIRTNLARIQRDDGRLINEGVNLDQLSVPLRILIELATGVALQDIIDAFESVISNSNNLFRVTGSLNVPTTGAGVELLYSGGIGIMQARDASGGVYRPLQLLGSAIQIAPAGTNGATFDGTKFAPVIDNAFDLGGASNRWNNIYGAVGQFNKANASGFRSDGAGVFATGAGVEVTYTGGIGIVQARDAGTGLHRPLVALGTTVNIAVSGTQGILADSAKFAPVVDNAFDLGGSANLWNNVFGTSGRFVGTRVTGNASGGWAGLGPAVEMLFNGGAGLVYSVDRTSGNVWQPLQLGGASINLFPGTGSGVTLDTTKFAPVVDNAFDLGGASNKWNNLHATNVNGTLGAFNQLGADSIRAVGLNPFATGSGIELNFSGGVGYVTSYTRPSGPFLPISLNGISITLAPNGGAGIVADTTKLAPVVDSAFDIGGASNYWNNIYGRTGIFTKANASGLRSDGAGAFATGAGAELIYSGGIGILQARDAGTTLYRPLQAVGTTVTIVPSGTLGIIADSAKFAPFTANGFALGGISNEWSSAFARNYTVRGAAALNQAQVFKTVVKSPLTASISIQGTPNTGQSYAGWEKYQNFSVDGSFGSQGVVDELSSSYDWTTDTCEGWVKNGGVPLGDDIGRRVRASVFTIYTTLQSRHRQGPVLSANGTGQANASGNITSISVSGGAGYTPSINNVDVIIIVTSSTSAQNKRITGNTDAGGNLVSFNYNGSVVSGGNPITGFNTNEPLYVFAEPQPLGADRGADLDIGPWINLSREPTPTGGVYPKAGTILGGIGMHGYTSNAGAVGGPQPYGYMFATVMDPTAGTARSRLQFDTASDAFGHQPAVLMGYRNIYGVKSADPITILTDPGPGVCNFEQFHINNAPGATGIGKLNWNATEGLVVESTGGVTPVTIKAPYLLPYVASTVSLGSAALPWSAVYIGSGQAVNTANNGSDFSNLATLRTNIGLGASAVAHDSMVLGSPVGGNKGAGTLNAVGVYDDNVLLTDYVFDRFFGRSSISDSPKIRVKHEELDGTMFDPEVYAAHWKQHGRLYGMPDLDDCVGGKIDLSLGELVQKLMQTVELQAIHIEELRSRLSH